MCLLNKPIQLRLFLSPSFTSDKDSFISYLKGGSRNLA